MIEGVDWSNARPDPAAVVAAGKSFVIRDLSGGNPKDLTAQERDQLLRAGLRICVVWQTDGQTGPRTGDGSGDATAAIAQARSLEIPRGTCLYFAVDYEPSSDEITHAIRQYFAQARDACHAAGYRVGAYGGVAVVDGVADLVDCCWQTRAWSDDRVSPHACLYQFAIDVSLAGGQVDLDRAMADDYGQFPSASTAANPIATNMEDLPMFEPCIVHTDHGSYYLSERGDSGVGGDGQSMPVVTTSADSYNAMCKNRQAAWAEYLAALRGQHQAMSAVR